MKRNFFAFLPLTLLLIGCSDASVLNDQNEQRTTNDQKIEQWRECVIDYIRKRDTYDRTESERLLLNGEAYGACDYLKPKVEDYFP